ncbi:MAG: hypothetical protein KDK24_08735, partial [Pseudooceanicola sp.]|nr:hypothetical protein [Pseudooceanicola sp.]
IVSRRIVRAATAAPVIVSRRMVRAAAPVVVSGGVVRTAPPAVRSAAVVSACVSTTFTSTRVRGGDPESGQAGQAETDGRNGKNGACNEGPGKRGEVNVEHLEVLLL